MSIIITHEAIKEALSYPAYVELASQCIANNQTTGANHDDNSVKKAIQGLEIIRNLLETVTIEEQFVKELQACQVRVIWLGVTESWCIDSANSLPVIYKMSQASPDIQMKIMLRDSTSIIDSFTTRGTRSIPKVICFDAESLVVLGAWGPRPSELDAKMMIEAKDLKNSSDSDRAEKYVKMRGIIKDWYKKDKTLSIQQEVIESLIP